MAGALTAKALDATRDVNGSSFRQAAQAVGYESNSAQVLYPLHLALRIRPDMVGLQIVK